MVTIVSDAVKRIGLRAKAPVMDAQTTLTFCPFAIVIFTCLERLGFREIRVLAELITATAYSFLLGQWGTDLKMIMKVVTYLLFVGN